MDKFDFKSDYVRKSLQNQTKYVNINEIMGNIFTVYQFS